MPHHPLRINLNKADGSALANAERLVPSHTGYTSGWWVFAGDNLIGLVAKTPYEGKLGGEHHLWAAIPQGDNTRGRSRFFDKRQEAIAYLMREASN